MNKIGLKRIKEKLTQINSACVVDSRRIDNSLKSVSSKAYKLAVFVHKVKSTLLRQNYNLCGVEEGHTPKISVVHLAPKIFPHLVHRGHKTEVI